MSTFVITLALCLTTQTQPLQQQVEKLVQQLDSADRPSRVAAEKKLVDLGVDVLPLLPAIDPATSAEVKNRLTRVRKILQDREAEASALGTTITLKDSTNIGKFIAAAKKQTGNDLIDIRGRFDEDVTQIDFDVDFQNTPFLQALDEVLDRSGMTVNLFGGEIRKLSLDARPEGQMERSGQAVYSGPFRIEPTEIFAQRDLRNSQIQSLRMRIEMLWEPKLLPIIIRQPYSNITAVGEGGTAIAVASAEGSSQVPVQSTVSGVDMVIPFELPDRSIKKISSLRGTLYAMVPGKEATFEFSKLKGARNVSQKKAGLTVTLDRVTLRNELLQVRVRLRLDQASESLQSHLDWASNNVIYLKDNEGKRYENPNFEQYLEREQEIGFMYIFPIETPIEKLSLIYKTPAAIVEAPIQYELKNIPLP